MTEERRSTRRSRNEDTRTVTPTQRAFWQAITIGELETMQVLLQYKDVDVNMYDEIGEQRAGCTALHLAILEMPTWKTEGRNEARNGIQTADYVKRFFSVLLGNRANINLPCRYNGEWYLQTAAGKTKSFFPEGYDALGLVLQFVEITRGAEVISNNVTKRLELIRDLLLEHIKGLEAPAAPIKYRTLGEDMSNFRLCDKFSDIQIFCNEEVIEAHRLVLAARSAVFNAMLSSDAFRECTTGKIVIEDIDPMSCRVFIEFLYRDSLAIYPIDRDFELCQSLIVLANRYDVPALSAKCSEVILKHHLNVEKAAEILRIAHENHVEHLKYQTLTYISNPSNIDLVKETGAFRSLESELVQEVLDYVLHSKHTSFPRKSKATSYEPSNKRSRTSEGEEEDHVVRAPPNSSPGSAEGPRLFQPFTLAWQTPYTLVIP